MTKRAENVYSLCSQATLCSFEMYFTGWVAILKSLGESLTQPTIHMKLFNTIAATAVIAGSLVATAAPASAQFYGNNSGYNKSIQHGYGNRNNPYDANMNRNNSYTNPRQNTNTQTINSYGRSSAASTSLNRQCSGYAC